MPRGHKNYASWDGRPIHNPPEKFAYQEDEITMLGEDFNLPMVLREHLYIGADAVYLVSDRIFAGTQIH